MPISGAANNVTLKWPTQFDVDLYGTYNVYRSAPGGAVADILLTPSGLAAWPSPWDAAKWTNDLDPNKGFPFMPVFGLGRFGTWAQWMKYVARLESDGAYQFAVTAVDEAGNESAETYAMPDFILAGLPGPPQSPDADRVSAGIIELTFDASENEYA